MRTLDEIKVLADKELVAIAKRAADIKNGVVATVTKGTKRKGGAELATPRKKGSGTTSELIEIDTPHKKNQGLNLPYILWGHSQKIQIAGVGCLVAALCRIQEHSLTRKLFFVIFLLLQLLSEVECRQWDMPCHVWRALDPQTLRFLR